MIQVRPADSTSRQSRHGYRKPEWQQRQILALLHALGLWDGKQIADAYGITRHSVYRAAKHFKVSDSKQG